MINKNPILFSLVKIDEKDEKYAALKDKFLSDLKENVLCDDHEPIIK